jgi:hypothetical protein
VRRRHALARDDVRVRQHLATISMPCAIVLRGAAGVLDAEGTQQRAFLQVLAPKQRADLVRFAAEADDEHAGEVRVPRIAAERAPQQQHAVAVRVHAAARAVRQRDDAVDVGNRGSASPREVIGDAAHDGRRAIDRRQKADVVARRDAAVGADDAVNVAGGSTKRVGSRRAERVVALERAHRQVVQMNMLAGAMSRDAKPMIWL